MKSHLLPFGLRLLVLGMLTHVGQSIFGQSGLHAQQHCAPRFPMAQLSIVTQGIPQYHGDMWLWADTLVPQPQGSFLLQNSGTDTILVVLPRLGGGLRFLEDSIKIAPRARVRSWVVYEAPQEFASMDTAICLTSHPIGNNALVSGFVWLHLHGRSRDGGHYLLRSDGTPWQAGDTLQLLRGQSLQLRMYNCTAQLQGTDAQDYSQSQQGEYVTVRPHAKVGIPKLLEVQLPCEESWRIPIVLSDSLMAPVIAKPFWYGLQKDTLVCKNRQIVIRYQAAAGERALIWAQVCADDIALDGKWLNYSGTATMIDSIAYPQDREGLRLEMWRVMPGGRQFLKSLVLVEPRAPAWTYWISVGIVASIAAVVLSLLLLVLRWYRRRLPRQENKPIVDHSIFLDGSDEEERQSTLEITTAAQDPTEKDVSNTGLVQLPILNNPVNQRKIQSAQNDMDMNCEALRKEWEDEKGKLQTKIRLLEQAENRLHEDAKRAREKVQQLESDNKLLQTQLVDAESRAANAGKDDSQRELSIARQEEHQACIRQNRAMMAELATLKSQLKTDGPAISQVQELQAGNEELAAQVKTLVKGLEDMRKELAGPQAFQQSVTSFLKDRLDPRKDWTEIDNVIQLLETHPVLPPPRKGKTDDLGSGLEEIGQGLHLLLGKAKEDEPITILLKKAVFGQDHYRGIQQVAEILRNKNRLFSHLGVAPDFLEDNLLDREIFEGLIRKDLYPTIHILYRLQLYSEAGWAGTEMEDIFDQAGLDKSQYQSLYRRFASLMENRFDLRIGDGIALWKTAYDAKRHQSSFISWLSRAYRRFDNAVLAGLEEYVISDVIEASLESEYLGIHEKGTVVYKLK